MFVQSIPTDNEKAGRPLTNSKDTPESHPPKAFVRVSTKEDSASLATSSAEEQDMSVVSTGAEVVEESGPVAYSEDEGEGEEGGLDDEEMDGLAYEGDPLLISDYEDGNCRHSVCYTYQIHFFDLTTFVFRCSV